MTTLKKPIVGWVDFYQANKGAEIAPICILGTQNAGKSTLCQLFMVWIAENRNKNLILQQGKNVKMYTLPNVISSNSLNIETIKPVIYTINSKNKNYSSRILIDTPTFTLPPLNQSNRKLWSMLQYKLSIGYLLHTFPQASYVLVIDEKLTRPPVDMLKTLLSNFVSIFNQHPVELYNCTAIVLSKCPSAYKLEQGITKIQAIINKLVDQNDKKIQEWFRNLKERNAIYEFRKLNTEEETKNEVIKIYEGISKLGTYRVQLQGMLLMSSWNEDLRKEFASYWLGFEDALSKTYEIFLSLLKVGKMDNIEELIEKTKNQICRSLNGQKAEGQGNKQQQQMPQPIKIIKSFIKTEKYLKYQNQKIFIDLLAILVKNGILSQTQQLYKCLQQRAKLFRDVTSWDSKDEKLVQLTKLRQKIQEFKELSNLGDILRDYYQENKQKAFYQDIIEIIQCLVPLIHVTNHKLSDLWIKCKLSNAAAEKSKAKALSTFLQIHKKIKQMKNQQSLSYLLMKIAETLINLNQVKFAVALYGKCGNPTKSIDIMQKILSTPAQYRKMKLSDFIPYLQLLQDIGLYEKSYQTCYVIGSLYDRQDRASLRNFLLAPPKGPAKRIVDSFLEKKVRDLEEKEVKELIELAAKLKNAETQQE